jgi:hypothetical protein
MKWCMMITVYYRRRAWSELLTRCRPNPSDLKFGEQSFKTVQAVFDIYAGTYLR